MHAFTASLALFLFFGQQQHGLASAQMAVLRTLVQSDCLQRCYIAGCDDLEPRCVCQQVADKPETGRACAVRTCSEENAYLDLWAECLSRRVDLGVIAPTTRRALPAPTTDATTPPPANWLSSTHASNHEITVAADTSPAPNHASDYGVTNAPTDTPTTAPGVIAVAVALPLLFLAALVGAMYLFIRRRQKRLSINTFMDESDANNPVIGSPLGAKKEELPPALNDLLRNGLPISLPLPAAARGVALSPPQRSDEDPFKDKYSAGSPVPGRGTGGGEGGGGARDTFSLFPAPVGGRKPQPPPPAPTPTPPPIPQSPKPVFSVSRSTSPADWPLSMVSEVLMGGSSSNTEVDMRFAFRELQNDDLGQQSRAGQDGEYSGWGGASEQGF